MKKCSVCDSTNRVCNYGDYKNVCRRHQNQIYKYGKILERTIKDPNEFHFHNGICSIVLYNRDCDEVARTKIDRKLFKHVLNHKWSLTKKGYVRAKVNGKDKYLHQVVLPLKDGMVIDHINDNPLDNRRSNLRLVTTKENNTYNKKREKGRK